MTIRYTQPCRMRKKPREGSPCQMGNATRKGIGTQQASHEEFEYESSFQCKNIQFDRNLCEPAALHRPAVFEDSLCERSLFEVTRCESALFENTLCDKTLCELAAIQPLKFNGAVCGELLFEHVSPHRFYRGIRYQQKSAADKQRKHIHRHSFKSPIRQRKQRYYDPTFPRRAGLTARADYSTLQRHQKVRQHAVMKNDENSTSKKNSRRGNRNIDKRKTRYEQWKTLRRNNRRHWREIKQNDSTALRNLVATSLLYPATQEPILLANADNEGVTIANSPGQTPRKEHYHKKKSRLVSSWLHKIQNAKGRKRQKQYSQMKKQTRSFHTRPEQDFQPPDPAPEYAGSKIPYASTWRIATPNCRGLNSQSKREQIMEIMHQLNIDILALQKIKVNLCTEEFKTIECTDKVYKFFFKTETRFGLETGRSPQSNKDSRSWARQ